MFDFFCSLLDVDERLLNDAMLDEDKIPVAELIRGTMNLGGIILLDGISFRKGNVVVAAAGATGDGVLNGHGGQETSME